MAGVTVPLPALLFGSRASTHDNAIGQRLLPSSVTTNLSSAVDGNAKPTSGCTRPSACGASAHSLFGNLVLDLVRQ
jgi:hypothetical protein